MRTLRAALPIFVLGAGLGLANSATADVVLLSQTRSVTAIAQGTTKNSSATNFSDWSMNRLFYQSGANGYWNGASHYSTFLPDGATGTGLSGYLSGTSGTKRAGQNMIDAQGDGETISSSILFVDFDQPGTSAKNVVGSDVPLPLEYLIAPGDSGGGLFITENEQTFLVGISSFTWGILDGVANSSYGDVAAFTSTTSQLAWIHTMTGVPIPEPSALSLLLAGLGLLFRKRRGSGLSIKL